MLERDALDRPPVVLIANDQEWSARSLESILTPSGYAVLRAHTGREALDIAGTVRPDVVILDERLPDIRGTSICRMLRDDPRVGARTPIVLTTADFVDREQALAGFRAGAWEYVSEPLDAEALLLRLATYVRAKRQADRVDDASLVDPLTGLYNLKGLTRRAREIGADAYRVRGAVACVAMVPEYGTDCAALDGATLAEHISEHVARILRHGSRASDAVGRIGVAEFALVAPHTTAAGAERLIERLREDLATSPLAVGDERRSVRLRAGYAAVADYAEADVDAEDMLHRATEALRRTRETSEPASRMQAFDQQWLRLAL
jgi:diguanylate cyclase (GGDEF)-like protein